MSHLHEETSPSFAKKYVAQVSQLKELFPDWNDDDLSSVLHETHGSVEVAVDRISQGQAQQWGAVSRKSKKPQPAGRDSPRGGRGQRGRGAARGGHRGGPSQRGSHSRAAPSAPTNGTNLEPSTSQAADTAEVSETQSTAPLEGPAAPDLKPDGTPATTKPLPKSNGTAPHAPAAQVHSPVPAPTAPPVKSWASLLKPKPAPALTPSPVKKHVGAPPSTQPATPQPQAPLTPEPVTTEHPENNPPVQDAASEEPEAHIESEPVSEPPLEHDLQLEPVPEPTLTSNALEESTPPEPQPVPVQEPQIAEASKTTQPQPVSPPSSLPPHHAPPGLNLVTQQAPVPEPAQAAPEAVTPPHQVVSPPITHKPAVQHRPSARYPKSDQAVVMPSGFGDLVTGMGGLSFGQFGDPEAGPGDIQSSPSKPQEQVQIPPSVSIPSEAPAPTQVPLVQAQPQEATSVPLHLNVSDQLPQAQDAHPIPLQNQHSQVPLLSHLPQHTQQVAPSVQSHFSPPVQTQPTAQAHFPAQLQQHLPQHQPVASTQSPQIQNAQQHQEQQPPLHASHLVHTQVHEPFPQHALSGVNLYQQASQNSFGQQPQQTQQPQQLHPGLRQSHLAQPQQQQHISSPAQQTQQPILGTSLGSHYQQPHLELGVGSEYGAFGNLGQPAAANFGGGPERYGYDSSHSNQGGFYDSPYSIPTRGATTSDDISKGSPHQQQSTPLSQNTTQSQQQSQQQPGQSNQQAYSGIAPMPYFYAPYYQNQYFGQPSPNYGQPFVKYPPMYPQQSQQQSQQQPQQAQQQPQQQPPQAKAAGSLYDEQYGQGGYQPQQQPTVGSDYAKTQQQQFGAQGAGLQSLLGGQGRAPVAPDMGLKGYGTTTDKSRVGQQQAPYYTGSMRYPQHLPHQQGYQQQQPDNNYYSYPGRQPQQPNQNYGQWP